MIDLKECQKRIVENKKNKGFNTTNMHMEFCLLMGEVSEAYEAWRKKFDKAELGSELADVAIYLMGLSELLGFNLEEEIVKKMDINEKRVYENVDGVMLKK